MEDAIDKIALTYYSRKDIQKAIFSFCQKRETVPRHKDNFGSRPDTLEYPSDVMQNLKKGWTSFHCSEELWSDPLKLSTNLKPEELANLREGWDLLIDIDSKYLDYSKIMAEVLIEALKFHGIKNLGIKFSGSKGFHIIIPWKAFPKEINSVETKNMFPDWARIIISYLHDITKPRFVEKISNESKNYVRDFEAAEKVMPDLVLVSSRHLFRAPYSLHEKGLVSAVIDESQIKAFQPKMAEPLRVLVKNFYPEAEENEARELLVSALDWKEKNKKMEKTTTGKKFQEIKVDKSKIVYSPCIEAIMNGLEDGRKRAVFILINYFRSLGLEFDEIEKKLDEWNLKNKPPLKKGYILSQLSWSKRQKKMLPPNCDKDYYKGIGVCLADSLCSKIKNPVNYTIKKQRYNR